MSFFQIALPFTAGSYGIFVGYLIQPLVSCHTMWSSGHLQSPVKNLLSNKMTCQFEGYSTGAKDTLSQNQMNNAVSVKNVSLGKPFQHCPVFGISIIFWMKYKVRCFPMQWGVKDLINPTHQIGVKDNAKYSSWFSCLTMQSSLNQMIAVSCWLSAQGNLP